MKRIAIALLAGAACMTTAQPAGLVTLPAAPPPGPWQVMRDALDGCAHYYGLVGDLRVRIEFDRFGKAIAVRSGVGDDFASCVGNAILRERYRTYASRAVLIAFMPRFEGG